MEKPTGEPNSACLLPLTPAVFHILLALSGACQHGYAIMKAIGALSGGKIRMGPGTFYGSIKRMLEAGLIEECDERPDPELDDQRRRYYRLTPFGQRVLQAEVERLVELVRLADSRHVLAHRP